MNVADSLSNVSAVNFLTGVHARSSILGLAFMPGYACITPCLRRRVLRGSAAENAASQTASWIGNATRRNRRAEYRLRRGTDVNGRAPAGGRAKGQNLHLASP